MASGIDKLANELKSLMTESDDRKPKPYDSQATVLRVEDGVAWVHIPGGVEETPVRLTMDAKKGDTVNIHVANGSAWITGNSTSPPTDNTVANQANDNASKAKETASRAMTIGEMAIDDAARANLAADFAQSEAERATEAANDAQEEAERATTAANSAEASARNANEYASRALGNLSTVQSVAETLTWITQHGTMALTSDTSLDPTHVYFVRDANGDYTVGSYSYSIVVEPDINDISTYYELSIDESLNNYVGTHLALTNDGLWLLPAASGTHRVLIATGATGSSYTAGTYIVDDTGGVVASFLANSATVGALIGGHTTMTSGGMKVYGSDGTVELANIGYGEGNDESGTNNNAPYYTLGLRESTSTTYSSSSTYNLGDLCVRNNKMYTCISKISSPEAWNSDHWKLAIGNYSLAGGQHTIAAGAFSHAEGNSSGINGVNVPLAAIGGYSHAEGTSNIALGLGSHAEGFNTQALGDYSHSGGDGTIAASVYQTVVGTYNVKDDSSKYKFIVGNGTFDSYRGNALAVGYEGNLRINGNVYVNCDDDSSNGAALMCYQYAQATGTSNTLTTITSGTITQVPLTSLMAYPSSVFELGRDGIYIKRSGKYRVSGSVYISTPANAAQRGVYILVSPGYGTFSDATEVNGSFLKKPTGETEGSGYSIGPKILNLSQSDIVYLAVRYSGGTGGGYYGGNTATYLLIERIA